MASRVLVIRHGESLAQTLGRVAGHTCEGLSPRGFEQAHALASRLRRTGEGEDATGIHTSLLLRAQQTAQAIHSALALATSPTQACDLCEIHPGDAEGHSWAEVPQKWPAVGDPDDVFRRRLPGMETWAEMATRVGSRLRELLYEDGDDTVIVVGSGGTVGASFVALGNLPFSQLVGITRAVENASITEWRLDRGQWVLKRFNDTGHV